jgi:hypothetical protein
LYFSFGEANNFGGEDMVIKIFKISTMELWTLKNKDALVDFIEQETDMIVSKTFTIKQLIEYLPIENYHYIK